MIIFVAVGVCVLEILCGVANGYGCGSGFSRGHGQIDGKTLRSPVSIKGCSWGGVLLLSCLIGNLFGGGCFASWLSPRVCGTVLMQVEDNEFIK